jgi:membrane protein DedA with SNARE-associated domain
MNDILISADNCCPILFFFVLLEQIGLPIPAAPCLLAAGSLYAAGESSACIALLATALACLLADVTWFYIGRRGGKQVLHFIFRFVPSASSRADSVEQTFNRYSLPVIVFAKFVPGLSVLTPPLAGSLGIDLGRFLLYDTLGSLLYGGFYLLLGALLSEQVQALLDMLDQFGLYSLLVIVALTSLWSVFRRGPRRKQLQVCGQVANTPHPN